MTQNGQTDLRERIRGHKIKGKKTVVEGWDKAEVELRSMSITEKASLAIDDEDVKADEAAMMLPKVVVFTCHDPATGDRLFTDDDLDWLKDEPASVIEELALEGFRVSGLDEEALQAAKKGS